MAYAPCVCRFVDCIRCHSYDVNVCLCATRTAGFCCTTWSCTLHITRSVSRRFSGGHSCSSSGTPSMTLCWGGSRTAPSCRPPTRQPLQYPGQCCGAVFVVDAVLLLCSCVVHVGVSSIWAIASLCDRCNIHVHRFSAPVRSLSTNTENCHSFMFKHDSFIWFLAFGP